MQQIQIGILLHGMNWTYFTFDRNGKWGTGQPQISVAKQYQGSGAPIGAGSHLHV
jgi:hypothetical protein